MEFKRNSEIVANLRVLRHLNAKKKYFIGPTIACFLDTDTIEPTAKMWMKKIVQLPHKVKKQIESNLL